MPSEVPDATIVVRGETIAPADTDPDIDQALDPHYVAFAPSVPLRGRLFLFMPGAMSLPIWYRRIADQGARNGFHAVVLRFPNTPPGGALMALCADDPSTQSFEDTRLQMLDGAARPASRYDVNRTNSIESRLLKLLSYLDAKYPNESWGAFADGSGPKWDAIVVAGHSLGAGEAALIAREHLVARVAMLAGPPDHTPPGRQPADACKVAEWLRTPHKTPSARYFAFAHAKDEAADLEVQWAAMAPHDGTSTQVIDAADMQADHRDAQYLLTRFAPGSTSSPAVHHAMVAIDAATPIADDGEPAFAPIWQYVCFG